MPVLDWSSTAAWLGIFITLSISIITPAVSTYLSNRFQLKLKMLEINYREKERTYDKKVSAYENALRDTGKFLHYTDIDNYSVLGSHLYNLYLYLPPDHWPTLDELLLNLKNENINAAQQNLVNLSKILSSELSKCSEKHITECSPR